MAPPIPPSLEPIPASSLTFTTPSKRINTHADLEIFKTSPGYILITSFISHINASISPLDPSTNVLASPEEFTTNTASLTVSPEVTAITSYIGELTELIAAVPPKEGPRRYGNVAFRTWLEKVQESVDSSLAEKLPEPARPAVDELKWYLLNSFGSGGRLDYGTGHELNFAAFLAGIWRLGGFAAGRDEKALALRTFDTYFKLVRKLVVTYSLEPAGSHGVWGLDDHAFLPYIFGSSQLTTFRLKTVTETMTEQQSVEQQRLPRPEDVVKKDIVDRERERSLYFDAIGFIYDVKKGPFWEHSPILFDISGVQKGWGKINEGMLKMYSVEVLGKFPVVQHFHFGSLFAWPHLTPAASQPQPQPPQQPPLGSIGTQPMTRAPWAAPQPPPHPTSAGLAAASNSTHPPPPAQLDGADTRAPWAMKDTISPLPGPPPVRKTSVGTVRVAETGQLPHAPQPHSPRRATPTSAVSGDIPPWEMAVDDGPEEIGNVRSEANLGGKRTCSPDSAMAAAEANAGQGSRRSSSTGGVRVAETGDLRGRRASRTGPVMD